MSAGRPPSRSWTERVFRALVRVFPFDFRVDHGREMEQTFRTQHQEVRREGTIGALVRLWLDVARDLLSTAPREHAVILRQDVAYALRGWRRAPVFAISAVLTLALGLSVMTGMASIVNAVMFRPLPVENPEQLISISNRNGVPYNLSYKDLQDYGAEKTVVSDAMGYASRVASLSVDGGAERVTIQIVTDNYFSMLGVQPAVGRVIRPGEGHAAGDAPVLVLTHAYWQSRFGGDPSVVGRSVRLGSQPFTIVGVAAASFRGTESLLRVAGFVPAWMAGAFAQMGTPRLLFEYRGSRAFTVLARLKPEVSLNQARAALNVRAAALARDFPDTHKDVSLRVVPETHTRPTPELGSFLRVATAALAGLAALVVLITGANVANLLMARAASRGREVALRSALGARRGRIARQFVTEGITLALLGFLVAIPVAAFATRSFGTFVANASAMATLGPDFSLDLHVLATMLAMAIGAGIVAGLAPALLACRTDLDTSLKRGARGAVEGAGGRVRTALVVVQVALSLTLLVSGGLFVRSLDRARAVDLGFDPNGVLVASASPGLQGYDTEKRLAFFTAVRDRVAGLPGVNQAGWIHMPPLGITFDMAEVVPEPRPSDPDWQPIMAPESHISPEYVEAARLRLVDGRAFDARDDANGTLVAIVNETLARQLWPNQSPIGQHLVADKARLEVVGVMGDGKYVNVNESPRGAIFRPLAQTGPMMATLAIRVSGPPVELARAVREAIRQVDPDVAVYDVRSMMTHLDHGTAYFVYRIGAFMTALFGGIGLLLASVGLYGVIAYHVGQRTQEIGVRMALGARAGDIIREVLARASRFALIGIAVGVVLSAGVAQLLKGLLLGVSPFDPITYAAVAALLIAICLLASFVPARRATVVDPLIALRAE